MNLHSIGRSLVWGFGLCLGLGALTGVSPVHAESLSHTRPSSKPAPKIAVYDFSGLVKRVKPAVFNLHVEGKRYISRSRRRRSGRPFDDFFSNPWRGRRNRRYRHDPYRSKRFRRWMRRIPVRRSRGSGFLINSQGYALTNHHVVKNAGKIRAQLANGHNYDVKVIGTSPLLDIALIKLKAPAGKKFPYVYLGNSQKLPVGAPVMAIENARGLGISVTAGIVSAKGRILSRFKRGRTNYDNYIQTDAAINKGNSGGPLFNKNGDVIGINTAILRGGRGIGFAVPINVVRRILPQLKKYGRVERAKLGVLIQPVTPSLARSFGLSHPHGALVNRVVSGSPAQRAGLRQGDVIVSFNGKKVLNSSLLPRMVAFNPPGTKAKLGVLRSGKMITLYVSLTRWGRSFDDMTTARGRKKRKPIFRRPSKNGKLAQSLMRLGVNVSTISTSLRKKWGLPANGGVRIISVRAGSPADANGLRSGDVIMKVNRNPISSIKGLARQIASIKSGDNILLLIRREDSSLFLAFNLK